jgi:hypothetical protein
MYKIGFTENDPQLRANQLRKTGVIGRFKVEFFIKIKQYREMEKHIHSLLDKYRVEADREFFKIDISIIKFIFDLIEGKINGNKIEDDIKKITEINSSLSTKLNTEVLEELNEDKHLSLTKPNTDVLKELDDIVGAFSGLIEPILKYSKYGCFIKPCVKYFNVVFEKIAGKILNDGEKAYFIKKFDTLSGKKNII